MTTFSLAQTAIQADAIQPILSSFIPDSMVPISGITLTTGTVGGMQGAMAANTPLLCKGPDGALGVYTLDAERSTPTRPVIKQMFP